MVVYRFYNPALHSVADASNVSDFEAHWRQ